MLQINNSAAVLLTMHELQEYLVGTFNSAGRLQSAAKAGACTIQTEAGGYHRKSRLSLNR